MTKIPHPGQAEVAVRDTLQTWLSTILADLEDENGLDRGAIERPHDWVRTADPEKIPIRSLPTVAIVGGGLMDDPEYDTDTVSTWWAVSVSVFAKGRNRDESLDNARMLTAAARQAVLSKVALDARVEAVRWEDEDVDVVSATRERTLAAGDAVFAVLIVTDAYGPGPAVPDPPDENPDHPDPPTADTVEATVNQIEET